MLVSKEGEKDHLVIATKPIHKLLVEVIDNVPYLQQNATSCPSHPVALCVFHILGGPLGLKAVIGMTKPIDTTHISLSPFHNQPPIVIASLEGPIPGSKAIAPPCGLPSE